MSKMSAVRGTEYANTHQVGNKYFITILKGHVRMGCASFGRREGDHSWVLGKVKGVGCCRDNFCIAAVVVDNGHLTSRQTARKRRPDVERL
jgi:hypothetical protein